MLIITSAIYETQKKALNFVDDKKKYKLKLVFWHNMRSPKRTEQKLNLLINFETQNIRYSIKRMSNQAVCSIKAELKMLQFDDEKCQGFIYTLTAHAVSKRSCLNEKNKNETLRDYCKS